MLITKRDVFNITKSKKVGVLRDVDYADDEVESVEVCASQSARSRPEKGNTMAITRMNEGTNQKRKGTLEVLIGMVRELQEENKCIKEILMTIVDKMNNSTIGVQTTPRSVKKEDVEEVSVTPQETVRGDHVEKSG